MEANRIVSAFVVAAALAAALVLSCSGKQGNPEPPAPAADEHHENGNADAGGHPGEVGEPEKGGEGAGSSDSVTKGERKRLNQALGALKNNVLLGDPDGFRQSFLDVVSLRSIITATKGPEAWQARLREAGAEDDLDFEKAYGDRLERLYEGLRIPGERCELTQERIMALRGAGDPDILLADTFASGLGRNFVVVQAALRLDETVVGLLRLRSIPHKNQLKWYFHGDERIASMERLASSESERLNACLKALVRAQKAFCDAAAADVDGDGRGEFAFLPELAGLEDARGADEPYAADELPPLLREVSVRHFALVDTHLVRVFLPGPEGWLQARREGFPEAASVTDARESMWCAVAWPLAEGVGDRIYFVGPSGTVLRSAEPASARGPGQAPPAAIGLADGRPLEEPGTSGSGFVWVAAH